MEMALNNGVSEDSFSAQLIILARQQLAMTTIAVQHNHVMPTTSQSGIAVFLHLLDSVDVQQTAPLLEASTVSRYKIMLKIRWPLLTESLETAARLPVITASTENLTTAPPGMPPVLGSTLHQHFGSASKAVSCLVEGSPVKVGSHEKTAMAAFVKVCNEQIKAPVNQIKAQLIGAILAGLLAELSALLSTSGESRTERRVARRRLRHGLSDLLDICDILTVQSTEHVLEYSKDYLDNDREKRARRLLETAHTNHGDCMKTRLALARFYVTCGHVRQSIPHLQAAVSASPDDCRLRTELASALLKNLEFREAIFHFTQSREDLQAEDKLQANRELELAMELNECEISAATESTVPTITLTDEERLGGVCNPVKLLLAANLYRTYGTLVIHNVFSVELIDKCRKEFLNRYRHYFTNRKHSSALQIGDRRFQISLALSGAFNDPEFYANEFIVPLMKQLLGDQMIIGSTVCATSLPGSRDQHGHKDHRALFTDRPDDDPLMLPPVAVTTMIPLVSVDEEIGTTLVKKGSHRLSRRASSHLEYQIPIVPAGSCYLMDLALTHKGQGNHTDQVRPIVNMVYHRSWFVDNKNFGKQPPLQIDSVDYRQIPVEHRCLFDWAIQPGALVNNPR